MAANNQIGSNVSWTTKAVDVGTSIVNFGVKLLPGLSTVYDVGATLWEGGKVAWQKAGDTNVRTFSTAPASSLNVQAPNAPDPVPDPGRSPLLSNIFGGTGTIFGVPPLLLVGLVVGAIFIFRRAR